jgi:hypothetical protein
MLNFYWSKWQSNTKIDNSFYERLEAFKYLGTTLKNKNYILEEIKSRLKSENACCQSMHIILSSSLLSKNVMINIYIKFGMGVKLGRSH